MSNSEEYRQRALLLFDDICREREQAELPSNERSAEVLVLGMEVDGASFNLVHDANLHRDQLLLDCVLGPPPDDPAELRRILEGNLVMLRSMQGSYGWWRDKNLITYSSLISMRTAAASSFIVVMQELAVQARKWASGGAFAVEASVDVMS